MVEAAWSVYDQQYSRLSKLMEDAVSIWEEAMARTRSAEKYPAYVQTMRPLREQRWDACDMYTDKLLSVLLSEQRNLRNDVLSLKKRVEQARQQA